MENTTSTKQRILYEALVMFSENGYNGTNLRELAQRLNLSKSALYKHFTSKEDIWNTLVEQMNNYYNLRFGSESHLPKMPDSIEEFVNLSISLISTTTHDKSIVLVRKVLNIEQYREPKVAELASNHFIFGLQKMFIQIFKHMKNKGLIKDENIEMLSLEYVSTISSMIHLIDRQPEKETYALDTIKDYILYFIGQHRNDKEAAKNEENSRSAVLSQ